MQHVQLVGVGFTHLPQQAERLLRFALIVRVIASWFGASPYRKWMRPVALLTDWILEPLRRVLPPFGPLDLSPLVAYFILWIAERVIVGAFL